MGAIVDKLRLGRDDIHLLKKRYPDCVLSIVSTPATLTQQYKAIIPSEDPDGDSYYLFLVDNRIAAASSNFRSRLEIDENFKERMRTRPPKSRI